PKELAYFTAEEDFDPEPFMAAPDERRLFHPVTNFSRGRGGYERHFSPGVPARGESTPAHTSPGVLPGVADPTANLGPNAKLIQVVRDPIDRILSHYAQHRDLGHEWREPAEALREPNNIYVARTRYVSLLRPYLRRFPRAAILILRQDELLTRRRETLEATFRFLGVEQGFWSSKMAPEPNGSTPAGWRPRLLTRARGGG